MHRSLYQLMLVTWDVAEESRKTFSVVFDWVTWYFGENSRTLMLCYLRRAIKRRDVKRARSFST